MFFLKLSLFLARIKKIHSKMKALEWSQQFSQVYVDLYRRSGAANSTVRGQIWQKVELIQAFIFVLVICKNKEKNKDEGAREATILWIEFSDAQVQLTPWLT